jgi:hypothetical protein
MGAESGGLGVAVALSADGATALIGTTHLGTHVGAAYVFRAATDDWISSGTPDAVLTDGWAGLFGDDFGGAVALSPDGRTALVGAPAFSYGSAGAAYLFRVRAPDDWPVERALIQHGRGDRGGVPGWSVALSAEGTALVGVPSVFGGRGAADVLHIVGSAPAVKLTDAAGPLGDLFGAGVELSSNGATALVASARAAVIFTRRASGAAGGCYVPYVVGGRLPAAKRAIDSTHCRIGRVTRVSAPRGRSGQVISQRPEPGKRLARGARIDLSVR